MPTRLAGSAMLPFGIHPYGHYGFGLHLTFDSLDLVVPVSQSVACSSPNRNLFLTTAIAVAYPAYRLSRIPQKGASLEG